MCFDVEQMVQLEGNTAAYIQYSVARIRSILAVATCARPKIGSAVSR